MIFNTLSKHGIPYAVVKCPVGLEMADTDEPSFIEAQGEWFILIPKCQKGLDLKFIPSEYSKRTLLERTMKEDEIKFFRTLDMKCVHETKDGRVYEYEGQPVKYFYAKRQQSTPKKYKK